MSVQTEDTSRETDASLAEVIQRAASEAESMWQG